MRALRTYICCRLRLYIHTYIPQIKTQIREPASSSEPITHLHHIPIALHCIWPSVTILQHTRREPVRAQHRPYVLYRTRLLMSQPSPAGLVLPFRARSRARLGAHDHSRCVIHESAGIATRALRFIFRLRFRFRLSFPSRLVPVARVLGFVRLPACNLTLCGTSVHAVCYDVHSNRTYPYPVCTTPSGPRTTST